MRRKVGLLLIAAALMILTGAAAYLLQRPDQIYLIRKNFTFKETTGLVAVDTNGWSDIKVEELLQMESTVQTDALLLVNTEHMLPDDFEPDITMYKDSGLYMTEETGAAYAALAAEVEREFSNKLFIKSAYRSADMQREEYESGNGKATQVGASEHQAGLALDVYFRGFGGNAFIKCEEGRWVEENCQKFGFIVRYPFNGKDDTGIAYEPWHLRYVGLPHAQIISDAHITLEEYMNALKPGVTYRCKNAYFIRSNADQLLLPAEYSHICVSPTNMGDLLYTIYLEEN